MVKALTFTIFCSIIIKVDVISEVMQKRQGGVKNVPFFVSKNSCLLMGRCLCAPDALFPTKFAAIIPKNPTQTGTTPCGAALNGRPSPF